MNCPLCGFTYDEKSLTCHSACPMASGCAIVCCPNCGYQMVDETKSSAANWLKKLLGVKPKPTPLINIETPEQK